VFRFSVTTLSKQIRLHQGTRLSTPLRGLCLVLLLSLMFSSVASAESEDADGFVAGQWEELVSVPLSTPRYLPSFDNFDLQEGTYTYVISWQGIPAAEASVSVSAQGPAGVGSQILVVNTAETFRPIDLLYKLRFRAETLMNRATFVPDIYSVQQKENSRVKDLRVNFSEDGQISAVRVQHDKREMKRVRFVSQNDTLDPVSAAFLARSQPWRIGESRSFDVFNGKSRYVIHLTAKERTSIEAGGRIRPAIMIVPKVENLVNPNQSKKLREARIYLSDDRAREILLIESEVFIGTVRTRLKSFSPLVRPELREVQVIAQTKELDKSAL
jgi:hypothetical protein